MCIIQGGKQLLGISPQTLQAIAFDFLFRFCMSPLMITLTLLNNSEQLFAYNNNSDDLRPLFKTLRSFHTIHNRKQKF